MTIALMLGTPGQAYYTGQTTYRADANGVILAPAAGDIKGLLDCGVTFGAKRARYEDIGVVLAASATRIVASTALSAGQPSIAAQPDVPRPVVTIIFPGTSALTGGQVINTYTAPDGTSVTDTISLSGIAANTTVASSKGVSGAFACSIAAPTGGASPGIEIGTNANIAVSPDSGFAGLTFTKAEVDDADATLPTVVSAANGIITPATAPNGTHSYSFGYTFYSP